MKITEQIIDFLDVPDNEKKKLFALLKDLKDINAMIVNDLDREYHLEIQYQNWHDDYSPERTDPCPDYYGYYFLIEDVTMESMGVPMNIKELDETMCAIMNLLEAITGKYNN